MNRPIGIVIAFTIAYVLWRLISYKERFKQFMELEERSLIQFHCHYQHPRNDLLFLVLNTWWLIFLLSLASAGLLWLLTISFWGVLMFVLIKLSKLWKKKGYSRIVLFVATATFIAGSMWAGHFLRGLIGFTGL